MKQDTTRAYRCKYKMQGWAAAGKSFVPAPTGLTGPDGKTAASVDIEAELKCDTVKCANFHDFADGTGACADSVLPLALQGVANMLGQIISLTVQGEPVASPPPPAEKKA